MGYNPKSLKNLTRAGEGRPRKYSEPKKQRSVSVTDLAWQNTKNIAKNELNLSMSELIEQIGRGKLVISRVND